MNELLKGALAFARRGVPIFPVQPRGKQPLTSNGFKDALIDQAQIEAWWKEHPNANIGIPTGQVSGFFVLDIDGDDGEASLRKL